MENSEPNTLNKANSDCIDKTKNLIINVVENENQGQQVERLGLKKA